MKKHLMLLLVVAGGLISIPGFSQELGNPFFDQFDEFLEEYHSESGLVDYVNIQKNNSKLDSLYKFVGRTDLTTKSNEFQKAFYINAYNIIVIKQVGVFYPIKSPFDVNGFFDNIKNPVAGGTMTLDELQKNLIISKFKDPRIHFALVCAAKGCPSLSEKAFRPENVEGELDRLVTQVCNDPRFVNVEGENVRLSKIFDWYEREFTANGSLIQFINQYREEPISKDLNVVFRYYDWTLNDESLAKG